MLSSTYQIRTIKEGIKKMKQKTKEILSKIFIEIVHSPYDDEKWAYNCFSFILSCLLSALLVIGLVLKDSILDSSITFQLWVWCSVFLLLAMAFILILVKSRGFFTFAMMLLVVWVISKNPVYIALAILTATLLIIYNICFMIWKEFIDAKRKRILKQRSKRRGKC